MRDVIEDKLSVMDDNSSLCCSIPPFTSPLSLPDVSFEDLVSLAPDLNKIPADVRLQLERDATYSSYIERQNRQAEALKRDEERKIPEGFDFDALRGLSNELKFKLSRAKPLSIAQAAKVDGVTPAALGLILVHLNKMDSRKSA